MRHFAGLVKEFQEYIKNSQSWLFLERGKVMIKKQYATIDILKFICALLVICIHTSPFLDVSGEIDFFVVQILGRVAVPFFFIISGFFVFSHLDYSKSWNDEVNLAYIKKYLLRIFKIYLLWTIIYLPLSIWNGYKDGFTITYVIRYIRDFFINGSYYHLWYLPGLIFSSAFVYFLLLKFGKKKTFFTVLILYIVGSLYNIYSVSFMDNPLISLYNTLFMTTRNGLFFGSIFVFLGAALANFEDYMDKRTCLFAGTISFIAMMIEAYVLRSFGFMHALTSMYLFLLPTVFFFFQYLIQVDMKIHPIYKVLRNMSLLIYVLHIMFVTIFAVLVPEWNSLFIYLGVVIATGICSYGILYGTKRFPILHNLY